MYHTFQKANVVHSASQVRCENVTFVVILSYALKLLSHSKKRQNRNYKTPSMTRLNATFRPLLHEMTSCLELSIFV